MSFSDGKNPFGKSVDYNSRGNSDLGVVEPLHLADFHNVGEFQLFYGGGEKQVFLHPFGKFYVAVAEYQAQGRYRIVEAAEESVAVYFRFEAVRLVARGRNAL